MMDDDGLETLQLDSGPDLGLDLVDLQLDFGDDDDDIPEDMRPLGDVAETEAAAEEEVSEVLQAFRDRASREEERYVAAVDSEYWFAVCFQTREQKEEFLRKAGWFDHGDKYLDGMVIARMLGIELEARVPPLPRRRVDRRLRELS